MKRTRRIAALFSAIVLGLATWFVLLLCYPSRGELRLSRKLGSGTLVARIPEVPSRFFGIITLGPPAVSGRYFQSSSGRSGLLQSGIISAVEQRKGELAFQILLEPSDKTWSLELTEKRPVYLRAGKWSWRIGTKTRVFHTRRRDR